MKPGSTRSSRERWSRRSFSTTWPDRPRSRPRDPACRGRRGGPILVVAVSLLRPATKAYVAAPGQSVLVEGRRRLRAAEKEMVEQIDGVGDLEQALAIRIGRIQASGGSPVCGEEVAQGEQRVSDVHLRVAVGVLELVFLTRDTVA